jgi:hypothetical protein
MRKLGVSRRQLFEQLDQPALSALPSEPFVYAEWRIRCVALDYHVDIEGHYHSVLFVSSVKAAPGGRSPRPRVPLPWRFGPPCCSSQFNEPPLETPWRRRRLTSC